jgi:hypothetical protein
MHKPDFIIPINCPICERDLIYLASATSIPRGELDTHFYRCPEDGVWKLQPNGRLVPHSFTN